MFLIALGFTTIAMVSDLKERRIPNWVSGSLMLVAVGITWAGRHPVGWRSAAAGCCLALGLGLAAYSKKILGGGDVKLLAGIGTALGWLAFLVFLGAASLFGGFFAIRAARRGEREIAYAPAMWLGLLTLIPIALLA